MTAKRAGAKCIVQLPGPGPWRLLAYRDMVVAICPTHVPIFLRDGKVVTPPPGFRGGPLL